MAFTCYISRGHAVNPAACFVVHAPSGVHDAACLFVDARSEHTVNTSGGCRIQPPTTAEVLPLVIPLSAP